MVTKSELDAKKVAMIKAQSVIGKLSSGSSLVSDESVISKEKKNQVNTEYHQSIHSTHAAKVQLPSLLHEQIIMIGDSRYICIAVSPQ